MAEYYSGYDAGLLEYCRPEIASTIGLRGGKFNARICPQELQLSLERDNLAGLVQYHDRTLQERSPNTAALSKTLHDLERQVRGAKMYPVEQSDILKAIETLRKQLHLDKDSVIGGRF